jgi:hypothetical protein
MRIWVWAALVVLGFSSVAQAQTPAGGEFRANTFVAGDQTHPLVAVGPTGDFMIAWTSFAQDGAGGGVFAQRYDALGNPQGAEFRVNTTTQAMQYGSDMAVDALGNYIVVWISAAPGQDGSVSGIVGRVYSPAGVPLTGEFLVNQFTAGEQDWPAVAALPGGGFVVVWESAGQDGNSWAVVARIFDSRGGPLTGDIIVNTFTPGQQSAAKVASDAAGNFTVVWHSGNFHDGDDFGIFGRRFNAAGAPLSGEFQINTYTPNYQLFPVVSAVPDGRFVVAWESGNIIGMPTQDGNNYGVYGRSYSAAGTPSSGEFQINVFTTDHQHTPAVTNYGNGSFLAAWYSQDQVMPFPNRDLFGRQYRAGVGGPEFRVNVSSNADQFLAALDADAVGNIVSAWASANQDGSGLGIYARRFGGLVPTALAVDVQATGSSNGNRVFESGELVVISPSWRNVNGATLAFDGAGSAFTGPAGPAYTTVDGGAGYGSVPNNTIGYCGNTGNCYAMRITGARPAAHWDAQFREDIAPVALGQSKAWTLHVGDTFTDVPRTDAFYRFIETVSHRGVMPGCTPTQFCVFPDVPRDQMAMFVLLAKDPTVPPACRPGLEVFADVPAASPYCRWVEELVRRGVVAGCGGGLYCPSQGVSREQLAVYLLKTLEGLPYVPPACGAPIFNDVPASSPFCPFIEELNRRAVVGGCSAGLYCPTRVVVRTEMSVFLTVTFGLTLYGP